MAIPDGTRAKALGLWHGLGNVVVTGLFIVDWFLRLPNPSDPGTGPIVLSFIGVALALVTGWMGGELLHRLAVGVDEGANLNAPSSLSHAPAVGSEQPDREDELRRREWGRILRADFQSAPPTLQLSATPHRTHANIGVNVNR